MTTITTCADARSWMDAYFDNELDLAAILQVERHLEHCPGCKQVYAGREALQSAIQSKLRYSTPTALRERLAASIRAAESNTKESSLPSPVSAATKVESEMAKPDLIVSDRQKPSTESGGRKGYFGPHFPAWASWAAAACFLAIAFGGFFWLRGQRAETMLARQVVPAHIRSLQVTHLTDVLSSDQHTVKPWFTGKIDFSPVVVDLASDGFPLIGGRLDYIEGHNAAALVYQRRKHTINIFVWPGDEIALHNQDAFSRQGFNMLFWSDAGLNYCAVSDVSMADLKDLAEKLRSAH